MKKFFLCLLALVAITAQAATTTAYTGTLNVKMLIVSLYEGESTVYVTAEDDGTYTFAMKDFAFEMYGSMLYLGNIVVSNITGTTGDDGAVTLSTTQTITIQDGDDTSIEWSGPSLGEISVTISATMTATTLNATITIPMGTDIICTFEGEATETGISTISAATTAAPTGTYTLDGRQVSEGYKGVVVKDGKKVLAR